ncbi:MAG TPA: EAL domain-containing protein [Candidatus Dormibacteraeota bacterium]|jgi:EAL domain-containing protein (putative c-di-GMP-specific phosphodiesterase class I)/CheY-like chemotaxis protein|nr:EAL domain-containing protein [Candidatus Dormibacteraeota bacterium]
MTADNPAGGPRVRVLIADDEDTVRDALGDLIRSDPSLELVAKGADAREAADLAESTLPDVALLDVRMPGGGVEAARAIRIRSPRTRIVALSASGSADSVLDMLRAGAVGYLVKGEMPSAILEAIHRVAKGRSPLSDEIAHGVVRDLSARLQADTAEMEVRRERLGLIEQALSGALHMVFQPVVELTTRRVVGYEALSRFAMTPERPPDHWFAEAAALGRGTELEVAALRTAAELHPLLPRGVFLAVNASPATVMNRSAQEVLDHLAGAGVVVVEVTEHAPVEDYDRLRDALAPLAARGVRLAVDDVGAGFASLRHIVKLGPDIIKLDIALTRGIDADPSLQALAAAMISFASRTGKEIIAEGIETEEELDTLLELGVSRGQGYLLGRPQPLTAAKPPD